MGKRAIRMGIDVGGTHTKAVAIDNRTHEIIGKSSVKTTHDHPAGVAAGVVEVFEKCLKDSNINPDEVIFVAHSTTQATNALIEGDVANVGVVGMSGVGLEGFLARRQLRIPNIELASGRQIKVFNTYIPQKKLSKDTVEFEIKSLKDRGAEVIVASMAFGVDSIKDEQFIHQVVSELGLPATMASEITKLYGLTRRTHALR